jgi:hypothetical protein
MHPQAHFLLSPVFQSLLSLGLWITLKRLAGFSVAFKYEHLDQDSYPAKL